MSIGTIKQWGHGIYKLENDVKLVYEIIEERKSYNGGLMNKVMRFKSDEILAEDNKYILKKQVEEDRGAYFNLYQEDSILAKKMPSNMFQDFFDKQWENMKQENSLYVSIFKNPDAVYLGNIILKNLESMTPELGIDILKKYHRKGVAYDTLRMFMKWARREYNIEYFLVRIYSDNLASLNLFQKLGAIRIGEEPSEFQVVLNRFRECLGEDEYEKIKNRNPDMEDTAKGLYIVQYKLDYR